MGLVWAGMGCMGWYGWHGVTNNGERESLSTTQPYSASRSIGGHHSHPSLHQIYLFDNAPLSLYIPDFDKNEMPMFLMRLVE